MSTFMEVATHFSYATAKKYTQSVEWNCFLISVVYVIAIFSIKAIMANRKPYDVSYYFDGEKIQRIIAVDKSFELLECLASYFQHIG